MVTVITEPAQIQDEESQILVLNGTFVKDFSGKSKGLSVSLKMAEVPSSQKTTSRSINTQQFLLDPLGWDELLL